MKKFVSLFLCLFLFVSCGVSENAESPAGTVEITITSPEGEILSATTKISEDSTVLDALLSAAKENDLKVVFSGGKTAAYITSIGDIATGDYGPMSGWIYTVNGESVFESCSSLKVQDGDKILWEYITEFTE